MQMLKDQDAQHLPGGKFNGWEKIVIAIVCKGKSRYETTEVFEKKHEKNILCPSDGTIHLLDLGSCCLKIFAQCECPKSPYRGCDLFRDTRYTLQNHLSIQLLGTTPSER